MGRHRSRRLFDIVALYWPVRPSDSRKFRWPSNNQGVQITNQNEDLRSSAKSAVKNRSFSCRAVSKPRMTSISADSNSYNLSELSTIQGRAASPYNQAATLDIKPRAKSYLRRSRSHLPSNHFQYARAFFVRPLFDQRIQVVARASPTSSCPKRCRTLTQCTLKPLVQQQISASSYPELEHSRRNQYP